MSLNVKQAERCYTATGAALIKEEDLNRDELYYFADSDLQFSQSVGNFEVVETIGNTMSIPENSGFAIPFVTDDQMNQLLLESTSDDSFTKIPIDFGSLFKMNGVKTEQPMTTSHYIKYKPDENGKHVKIWECGICHKEFGHQYILMRHLPTHTDERKFQCKQCGKAFRQMSTLSQHRAIHSKLRPYVCEVCQKTFNRVSTLISHRKTHTGLKPHRCHLCNKAFHQKGNLRNHIFTHTNERPYKCDVCQKGFNQMSNLMCHKFKAHQRADKPKYNCQTCGKEFDKRIGLRNHEQYEHGEPTASSSTAVNVPSVKYTNGVLVAPINTAAMKHAVATNQVPFALLRPLNGIPVLVRVLPAGDKQMLVPATAEDLKKFGEITIKKKEEEGEDGKKDEEGENKENEGGNKENAATTTTKVAEPQADVSDNTAVFHGTTGDDKKGATVQIRIPVVASVVQRCRDGAMHMDIESPGPRREQEEFFFTTTDKKHNEPTSLTICPGGSDVFAESNKISNNNCKEIIIDDEPSKQDNRNELPSSVSNDIQFFDLSTMNNDEDKNKIVLQKDFALNRDGIQIFDMEETLDMSAPIINLDDEESNMSMEEMLPTEMLHENTNGEIYEIIDTPPTRTDEDDSSSVNMYEDSSEDFEIRVD